jgi:hypothetical protein
MSEMHLSDDRIVELCLDAQAGPADRAHLLSCAACEGRRAVLAGTLREVSTVMVAEADAAVPPAHLDRQRARILQRVELDGRPARVISFPSGQAPEPVVESPRRHARWVAVAAAVVISFVVGQMAERGLHDEPALQAQPATSAPQGEVGPVRASLTDDDFTFGQIERAGGRGGPAALQPLDALTPRAWDAR